MKSIRARNDSFMETFCMRVCATNAANGFGSQLMPTEPRGETLQVRQWNPRSGCVTLLVVDQIVGKLVESIFCNAVEAPNWLRETRTGESSLCIQGVMRGSLREVRHDAPSKCVPQMARLCHPEDAPSRSKNLLLYISHLASYRSR